MSRGNGHIMDKALGMLLLIATPKPPIKLYAGYKALATFIYETESPTRAQVSAVGRAVRSMEHGQLVEVSSMANDLRAKVVRISPWQLPEMFEMLSPHYEGPTPYQLSETYKALLELDAKRWMSVFDGDGVRLGARPRSVVDGQLVRFEFTLASDMRTLETSLLLAR